MQQLEQNAIPVLILIVVVLSVLVAAVLVTVLASLWSRERPVRRGPFCGHCGKPLVCEPESAVALEDLSLYRYNCRHCHQPTLLPTPGVE